MNIILKYVKLLRSDICLKLFEYNTFYYNLNVNINFYDKYFT